MADVTSILPSDCNPERWEPGCSRNTGSKTRQTLPRQSNSVVLLLEVCYISLRVSSKESRAPFFSSNLLGRPQESSRTHKRQRPKAPIREDSDMPGWLRAQLWESIPDPHSGVVAVSVASDARRIYSCWFGPCPLTFGAWVGRRSCITTSP
jgi:hypothetical protein